MSRHPKQIIVIGTTAETNRDLSPTGRLIRKGTHVTIIDKNSTDGSLKVLFDGREFWLHKDDLKFQETK